MIWREPKNHSGDCYFGCCAVPQPTEIFEDASTNSSDSAGDDGEFQFHTKSQSPQLFTQSELNDVIRDLGLPKEKAEL
jgi:hypothetical protein